MPDRIRRMLRSSCQYETLESVNRLFGELRRIDGVTASEPGLVLDTLDTRRA